MKKINIELTNEEKNIITSTVQEWKEKCDDINSDIYDKESLKCKESLMQYVFKRGLNLKLIYSERYGENEVTRQTYLRRMKTIWNVVKEVILDTKYGSDTLNVFQFRCIGTLYFNYFDERKIRF